MLRIHCVCDMASFLFLMILRPPIVTRTDPLLPARRSPDVLGEAGPSFDLRQHVGDTRGRQHTVAGKRQMPSFVVPGIIVLPFLGDAQSLASEQGSITSGQILGDVAHAFVELRAALIEHFVWLTARTTRLHTCATSS